MSTREETGKDDPIIEDRTQLITFFASGEKPREAWRIGTEHEKFV
jgi:glutamate--cysteine ligase